MRKLHKDEFKYYAYWTYTGILIVVMSSSYVNDTEYLKPNYKKLLNSSDLMLSLVICKAQLPKHNVLVTMSQKCWYVLKTKQNVDTVLKVWITFWCKGFFIKYECYDLNEFAQQNVKEN